MPNGPQGQRRPADANQLAKAIVDIATGEVEERAQDKSRKAIARGKARASALTPEQRADIARLAAQARWRKSQ